MRDKNPTSTNGIVSKTGAAAFTGSNPPPPGLTGYLTSRQLLLEQAGGPNTYTVGPYTYVVGTKPGGKPGNLGDLTLQPQTKPPSTPKNPTDPFPNLPVNATPAKMKFNLPPHKWSLPLDQSQLNINNLNTTKPAVDHTTRRGIMWCYQNTVVVNVTPTTSNKPAKTSSVSDADWGFQFLWNPTTIGTALSRNANFTPSPVDKTAQDAGLVTAMEAVSFSIVIDRVNDFACARSLTANSGSSNVLTDVLRDNYAQLNNNLLQKVLTDYYINGYPSSPINPEAPIDQLKTLLRVGTMADLEYIFKMINGSGIGASQYTNALGRKTADIGFLAPTVIAVQFGPSADNNLSYVGYINGMTITHNLFTEDMIPIHSEIVMDFVAYSRQQLGQSNS
jgi:hypothetical protein